MSLPRIIGFASLLLLNQYLWKVVPFDFKIREFGKPIIWGGILISLHLIFWFGCGGSSYPKNIALGVSITTMFVGLFEEYAFRGTLLSGMSGLMSPLKAVVFSNIIFTVFHILVQPIRNWTIIFLIGCILASMRIRGISLFWLAVIHIIMDDLYLLFGLRHPSFLSVNNVLFNIGLLTFAVVIFPKDKEITDQFAELDPIAAR